MNYVNAPLVAAERGIEVVEERRRSSRDFTNLIAVSAGDLRVAGTTIGRDHRQWLVSALGFEVEIELAPRMVVLRYDDVPGVIGRVGTLLGEAGVNIANMAVSRNREGGKALMVLSIDSPASADVLARLGEGVDDAFVVGMRRPGLGRVDARSGGLPAEDRREIVYHRPQAAHHEGVRPRHRGLRSCLAPGAFFCGPDSRAAVEGPSWRHKCRNGIPRKGGAMVKVEAVVIRERIETVIDAVEEATGHVGVTVIEAVGHGRQRGITHEYRGRVFESRFLPKAC